MSQMLLLTANPKRRKAGKRKATRSPAQRAAFAKMIAANKRSNPSPARSGKKRRRRASVAAAPSRRRSGGSSGFSRGNLAAQATSLAKNGAIGGAGALGLDVIMGYANGILPASVASRVNSDGSTNWLYYGVKGALAVGVGVIGQKVVSAPVAAKLAEGALTVMAYELARGMMPTSVPLGFVNPAPTLNGVRGVNRILNTSQSLPRPGMNRIVNFPQPSLISRGNRGR